MDKIKDNQNTRGRQAESPSQIPKKGWKDIISRVKEELVNDHISIVSAGVAYYLFVALFPGLIAAISIYGLVMDPVQVEQQMSQIASILPNQASDMVTGILQDTAEKNPQTLGWSLALSVLLSLWFAHQGTSAIFESVNIAYNETEERGFFKLHAVTLLFTLGAIVIGIICTALVVIFPAMVESLNLPSVVETLIQWLRWPLLGLIIIGALGLIYKIAPDRRNPEFKWLSPGAVAATVLWIVGSLLFSLYINNFGNYDQMYGSFAAVIILMLWFYITAYIIILGAEINSEIEHQTEKDSTVGEDKPMGQREAYHADRLPDQDKAD